MQLETAFQGCLIGVKAVILRSGMCCFALPNGRFCVDERSVLRFKAAGFAFSRGIGCPETWRKACGRFCFAVFRSGFFLQFMFTKVVAGMEVRGGHAGKPVCVAPRL